MRLKFDQKSLSVKIQLTEEDLQEALEIKRTMMSEGWKILEKKFDLVRRLIIEKSEKDILDNEKRKLSDINIAIIRGFNQATELAKNIVQDADDFIKQMEEDQNATRTEGI